jgi:hypothetical protein
MAGFFDWDVLPPEVKKGLLAVDPPLESPLFSPDDLIGAGLAKGLLGLAISPVGKQSLIDALRNGGKTAGFELGDITAGQARRGGESAGQVAGTVVDATPKQVNHVYVKHVVGDGYTPEEIGKFAEEAMRPNAMVGQNANAGRFNLINRDRTDPVSGRLYDATMPLEINNDRLKMISIVPDGLRPRGKK